MHNVFTNRRGGIEISQTLTAIMVILIGSLFALSACGGKEEILEPTVYGADITALNENVTGTSPEGTARIEVLGDSVTISVEVSDLPPNMMHLQHYHGFVDGSEATCASMEQDVNQDSIVDLIETRAVSGVTLVPFHDDPVSQKIAAHSYPVADSTGSYSYQKTVSMDSLEASMMSQKGISPLVFENRVIYIHGIDTATALPETVQSLEGVPAHVTLPIACGKFELQVMEEEVTGGGGY